MELITVVIIVLSALVSVWEKIQEKRRGRGMEEGGGEIPQEESGERERRRQDWERELRRLLQPEQVEPAPAPPPLLPEKKSAPSVAGTPAKAKARVDRQVKKVQHALEEAREHSAEVGSIHDKVERRIEKKESGRVRRTWEVGVRRSEERGLGREIMRDRESVRRAMLGTIIFGPPRSLDPVDVR